MRIFFLLSCALKTMTGILEKAPNENIGEKITFEYSIFLKSWTALKFFLVEENR